MEIFTRPKINSYLLLMGILLFAACSDKDNASSKRSEEQDSLLRMTVDSIKSQSPQSLSMINQGMKTYRDSMSYYEYYVLRSLYYSLASKADSAKYIAVRTLEFANHQKWHGKRLNTLFGQAYEQLANYYFMFEMNMDSTIYYHHKAYDYMQESDATHNLPDISANMADAYERKNDMAKAAQWYRRSLFIADSLKMSDSEEATIYLGLAQVYLNLQDYNTAQEYFEDVSKVYDDLMPNMKIYFLNNYGNFFYYKKDYPKALNMFEKLKTTLEKTGKKEAFDMYVCKMNTADVYLNMGKIDMAQKYIDEVRPFFNQQNLHPGIYYVNTIQIGIDLKRNNLSRVKKILASEDFDISEPNMKEIRNKYLHDYYLKIGNYKRAYDMLLASTTRNDSIVKSKSYVRAADIMTRFRQDTTALHHQIEIKGKEEEVTKTRSWLIITISAALLLILLLILQVMIARKKNIQNKYDVLKLRMMNVRNRISPHFIFNVINHGINSDDAKNSDYMERLTGLLREGLTISHQTYINLKDELDFVNDYISLARDVIGYEFNLILKYPSEETLRSIIIPSMLVQILAENAIKHGLKDKEGDKTLKIKVISSPDYTDISVEDNGLGYNLSANNNDSTGTEHKVIKQTIAIINSRNKRKMQFRIHNIKDENGKIGGCIATLHIPTGMAYE